MEKIPRVCLIGPESTAKTTLARQLADHYGGVWVPEFARDYAVGKNNPLTSDDVEPIARGQIDAEESAAGASRLVVLDTDLISTVVYSRHYYGSVPAWIESEARRRRADLYLLMDVDLPWQADGARDRGERRAEMLEKFEKALREFDARYERISGREDDRLRNSIRVIDNSLSASS